MLSPSKCCRGVCVRNPWIYLDEMAVCTNGLHTSIVIAATEFEPENESFSYLEMNNNQS